MKQYLDLLQNILDNGVEKESGRANMPNTIGISKADISMKMSDGFPLLTTKKMYWKGIVHELLWFLRGETNIKYLVDNNVNIWNGDAYRWYLKYREAGLTIYNKVTSNGNRETKGYDYDEPYSMEKFIELIKSNNKYITLATIGRSEYKKLGDLGKVYGYQWRNQNGVDQVKDVVEGLKSNPYSRYHIIDGWNKADFPEMALPPCHLLYQFIVRPLSLQERRNLVPEGTPNLLTHADFDCINIPKFYLELNMYQRSVDSQLGLGFNLASMSLLLMIIAKVNNMIAGVANWVGGDTHLYVDHIEQAKEQITRIPFNLPTMNINKELNSLEDILSLTINDFELLDYKYHPSIKSELFTGLKK